MSLQPQAVPLIPHQTVQIAQAAFPQGNRYMQLRDELGSIYEDSTFSHLFPPRGQPAQAPWRLALVTIMQFAENLSDRQAADAVRGRIDWKYALSLEMTDSGFDFSVLSEFRQRLVVGDSEELLLNQLLTLCKERNWLKAKGQQRSDSTHVLARIRAVNRVECVGETMRYALNSLAALVPDWLGQQPILADEWITRYGHRMEDYRLPATTEKRISYARQIGQDGFDLLTAIEDAPNRDILWQLPAVNTLRVVWLQQFHLCDQQLIWRTEKEGLPPAARFISSPYDVQARYGRKNTTSWVGYKVHITETCEDDQPNLITQVVTTTGPTSDGAVTGVIHQALEDKDLLPTTHIVDTGYTDAELLVISRQRYGVDLLGPTRADYKWQARAKAGFAAADFKLDWSAKQAVCPQGQSSKSWTQIIEKGQSKVIIKFSQKICGNCLVHSQCTTGKRRSVTLRSEAHHHALVLAREREQTAEYGRTYARRAGIEGTISQGVRAFGLRRCRYDGLAKTHLQHVLTATAINLSRLTNWLNEQPRASSRQSYFVRLMARSASSA